MSDEHYCGAHDKHFAPPEICPVCKASGKADAGKSDWSILPWDAVYASISCAGVGIDRLDHCEIWRLYARGMRTDLSSAPAWVRLAEAALVMAGQSRVLDAHERTQAFMAGLGQVAEVMEYGARKYSRDGWRKVEPARYAEALRRHLLAATGVPGYAEAVDAETGLPHWAHAACNALFLVWFSMREG